MWFNHRVPDRPAGRLALPAMILGASGIGLAPIFVRWAKSEGVGPSTAAFYRLLLALPILAFWAWGERGKPVAPRAPLGGAGRALLAATGLFFAADLALWHASILRTAVAHATLLVGLASGMAALGAWALFRERPSRLLLGGLLLGLAGTALLMSQSREQASPSFVGDLLGFLAALFYAGYLLGVSRLRRTCSTAATMAGTGAWAALGLFGAALLAGETPWPHTARGWALLLGLALIAQIGGQTLIAYALAHLPVSLSAVGLLVQPVVAALFAWLFFEERLGARQGLGSALILAGIVLSRVGTPSSPRPG